MRLHTTSITGSTPVGHLFETDRRIEMFEGDASLNEVFGYFSKHAVDAVIITENSVSIGILTLKDAVRALQNWDHLLLPVRSFMASPLKTFDAVQNISDILDHMHDAPYGKIVVQNGNTIIGVMDHRDLLSLCYSQMTPLIKHEYHLVRSLLELVDKGKQNLLSMATTDTLTGVGNRRLFEEAFQAHQALSGRYEIEMFLLMFDIDDFKSINDHYGHNTGDTILKELTALISNSIRKSDIFARWGGEEFAILLRSNDLMRAADMAEQLRKRIDEHRFDTIIHVTCSFGVTSILPDEQLIEPFERADKALYRAKNDGKNLVRTEKPQL